MDNKVLSVSIAGYNIDPFIDNTVGSIVESEAINEIEIIIVNDGSKDDTSRKAHDLQEQYPNSIIVIDKENGGYGSTINSSMKIATGKYYRLLDGDDWYNTKVLEEYVKYLKTCTADIVLSPYYRVSDLTREETLFDKHSAIGSEAAAIDSILLETPDFVMHEIAVKPAVFRRLGKEITENCFYTDVEFTCNCFVAANTISRFDKPIYCYRTDVEGQSVSLQGLRKHYKDHPKVIDKVFSTYEENKKVITGNKKEILDYWISNLTRNAYCSYLVLESPCSFRDELQSLDGKIEKTFPELYKIGNNSKLVRALRKFRFRPYLVWCYYTRKRLSS